MVVHLGKSSLNNLKRMDFIHAYIFLHGKDDSRKRMLALSVRVMLMNVADVLTNEKKLASPGNHCWQSP